jgi:hypothetical protein
MTDEELKQRIAQLERELGISPSAPKALSSASEPKLN